MPRLSVHPAINNLITSNGYGDSDRRKITDYSYIIRVDLMQVHYDLNSISDFASSVCFERNSVGV